MGRIGITALNLQFASNSSPKTQGRRPIYRWLRFSIDLHRHSHRWRSEAGPGSTPQHRSWSSRSWAPGLSGTELIQVFLRKATRWQDWGNGNEGRTFCTCVVSSFFFQGISSSTRILRHLISIFFHLETWRHVLLHRSHQSPGLPLQCDLLGAPPRNRGPGVE